MGRGFMRPALGTLLGTVCAGLLAALGPLAARAQESPSAEPEPAADGERRERIVITGSPLGRSADELAVPVSVISRDELVEEVGATLGETLGGQAGITTTSYAGGASRPVIRGQDAFRVRVLENGVGTHDLSDLSADHAAPINPLTAQRVEVIRGPAALRYGGGAIGGVVNALSNRVPVALPDEPVRAELYSAYGFNGRERNLAGLTELRFGPVAVHLDAASRDSIDYRTPGRILERDAAGDLTSAHTSRERGTWTDSHTLSGGASWIGESARLGMSWSRFDTVYGIPDPGRLPLSGGAIVQNSPELSIDMWKNYATIEGDLLPGRGPVQEIRLRGGITNYHHDEIEQGIGITSSFDNDEREGRLEMLHAPLAGWSGAFGFQYRDRDVAVSSPDPAALVLLLPAELRSFSFYVFEELELTDGLRLDLGGRIEHMSVDGQERLDLGGAFVDRTFRPMSASAGLIWDVSDPLQLALTVSAAQRAPDPIELFAGGPHDATETWELGSSGHSEETSYTADLSARYDSGGDVRAEVNLFYTQYRDFIHAGDTGRFVDIDGNPVAPADPGALRELQFTQEDARFFGGEVELEWTVARFGETELSLLAQLDFVRARLLDSKDDVPRITPMRWGGGLRLANEQWTARVGFLHSMAQDHTGVFEQRTPSYTSLDASFRYRLFPSSAELPVDFILSGTNLLDARSHNHVSFKKEKVLLPGRSIRAGVHMRY